MKKPFFFAAFILFSTVFAQAQTAEEIVNKHLTATGAGNWAKVNACKMEANIASEAAAGMSIGWDLTVIRDKAARMNVSVMGMSQAVAINGDQGWSTNPFAGKVDPEPMTAEMVESMKELTDIDGTLVGYKEKGYTLEYVGKENVEGTETLKIKVNKGHKIEYSFFDPATYYEIKRITVEEVDGKSVESASLFSNFRTQEGIVLPFSMQQGGGLMGSASITITTITFNPVIDPVIFDMPKK